MSSAAGSNQQNFLQRTSTRIIDWVLIVGVCLFTTNCTDDNIDCGSDAVIGLARKIANDHPNNKLAFYLRYQSTMLSGAVKALRDEELKSAYDAAQKIAKKQSQLWDLAKNNISYNLNTIRMKAKDTDTGKLTCQAVMTAELSEWGSAKMDVAYTVEKTTKGELYVEIYGLE